MKKFKMIDIFKRKNTNEYYLIGVFRMIYEKILDFSKSNIMYLPVSVHISQKIM